MGGYYVYILRCRDKSLYIGQTSDPAGRLFQHQNGLVKGYTHGKRPVQMVWCEEFGSRMEALDVEWRLKKWSRAKKEALIVGDWARVEELAAVRSTTRRSIEGASSGVALTILAESSAPRPTSASGREISPIAARPTELRALDVDNQCR